jgi:hypothetical protein
MGIIFSCSSDIKDGDIDWSQIDLSNIDNLYVQPLPVIKKVVQGKWKWYVSYGGHSGTDYPENTYVEIKDNCSINTIDDGSQYIFFTSGKGFS